MTGYETQVKGKEERVSDQKSLELELLGKWELASKHGVVFSSKHQIVKCYASR